MERPNTVSGLVAKRAELVAYRTSLEAELRKVTSDIDHLDAAIRIFDPATTPAGLAWRGGMQGAFQTYSLTSVRS